ncbi:AMP-binding enzyme family protein [Ophiocordyceps camponoti-floridani]|uniref:AMP-binding enzyme family protein n=1 Tax=Ophiocordyceps camponoti-floridani TaxID=2030778 RepID=A0A8H4QDG7_9HYPO|nr:AMP-binding enzyme family protein [Ophiocordyceps camponoti-floridani]
MHLAALLWNSAEWALVFWAAARLGMCFVPLDPRAADDVPPMLSAVGPHVIVVQDADLAGGLAFGPGQLRTPLCRIICSSDGRLLEGWLPLDRLTQQPLTPIAPDRSPPVTGHDDDVALVIFTSGTTGGPKGCPHTSRNLVAQTNDFDPKHGVDRWLVHTPVSHIFAINNALRAWRTGDAVVFPSSSFDVTSTAQALSRGQCTIMSATPTLVKALLEHRDVADGPGVSLSMVTMAGACVGPDDISLCRRGLGARDVIQAYGMSEGGPLVSWARRDPLLADGRHPGVGKVLPGAAVRICRPGSRDVLRHDDVGELHVSGPSVISQYLAGADSSSFYTDSKGTWLVTGDRGKMDRDGVLYLMGRYKEMLIRGGENVHPARIEAALVDKLGIEAQVVAMPDSIAGQLAVAVVRLPQTVSKTQVADEARRLGPKYAVDAVYTLDELGLDRMPVTSLGKPKKALLREAIRTYNSSRHSSAQAKGLCDALAGTWEMLTGCRPSSTDHVAHLADSITLLRYCDGVLRRTGKRIYVQDLAVHDTVAKQAQLLLDRGEREAMAVSDIRGIMPLTASYQGGSIVNTLQTAVPSPQTGFDAEHWRLARDRIGSVGLEDCQVEALLAIKGAFHRMVSGQRPQSFFLRVVFRVEDADEAQVRMGVEKGLRIRPIFRTIVCHGPDQHPFHVVVDSHRQLFKKQIHSIQVDTEQEVQKLYSDDVVNSSAEGLMFKADIITSKDTGRLHLSLTYNHSVVDAVFLLEWHRDLGQLISSHQDWALDEESRYGLWVDLFSQYQDSLPARASVSYHVARLRGISRLGRTLWPPQRAPGWMISNDRGSPHSEARHRIRELVWKDTWFERATEFRYPRRGRVVCVSTLPEIRRAYDIEPALFAKCAVVIFNRLQTGSPYAVFTSWKTGRSWPFLPCWAQRLLPPAASIDGPTAEWALNVLEVIDDETVGDFMKRMAVEHAEASRHQHVPWDSVVSELKEEGAAATEASFRQSFVWDVGMGIGIRPTADSRPVLIPVARHDWADFGFCWNMFLAGRDSIFFIASWDTAQLEADEVEQHCDVMADVMRLLSREASWEKPMGQVFATGRLH